MNQRNAPDGNQGLNTARRKDESVRNHRSTTPTENESPTENMEPWSFMQRLMRLPDGSTGLVSRVVVTPRGTWLYTHPGGWWRYHDLEPVGGPE